MTTLMEIEPGTRFGLLTVQWYAGNSEWFCKCDCGGSSFPKGYRLRNGRAASCGCRNGKWTHGANRHPLYPTWNGMILRCRPGATSSPRYYDRGIRVCDRWLQNPWNFFEDMGPRPEGHTLERNDNDGHYTPENCRWATPKEQQANTTRGTVIPLPGEETYLMRSARHRLGEEVK